MGKPMLSMSMNLPKTSRGRSWLNGTLWERSGECQSWLRSHVIGSIASDGGVRDRCGSRVLESTLMLHLLRAENAFPGVQQAVERYLEQRRKELAPPTGGSVVELEKSLIDGALRLPQD